MKSEQCMRYLEDPEANGAHLSECAECRTVFEELRSKVDVRSVRLEALPLAPWEGASYRSWPLVVGSALTVLAIAAALFAAAGASPVSAIGEAVREAIPASGLLVSVLRLVGGTAPVAIIVSFIVVNAVLFALLRRAPKGIDV